MTDGTSDDGVRDLRSYGRRRGRKLSTRQERLKRDLLPRISPSLNSPSPTVPARDLLGGAMQDIWLEIGFGGGEHLLWQARHRPDIGFIGAEPFEDGVVKVLAAIEAGGIENILVHGDDVRPVLRWLPAESIGRAFILFPDPWPKRRHAKRRLVNAQLLDDLVRVMRPGAELRIATDIGDYARTILMALQATPGLTWTAVTPDDWRYRPDDWPATRYEEKALREGRRPCFLRIVRNGNRYQPRQSGQS